MAKIPRLITNYTGHSDIYVTRTVVHRDLEERQVVAAPPGFNMYDASRLWPLKYYTEFTREISTALGLNGSGCPAGSATYQLAANRQAVTVTFRYLSTLSALYTEALISYEVNSAPKSDLIPISRKVARIVNWVSKVCTTVSFTCQSDPYFASQFVSLEGSPSLSSTSTTYAAVSCFI